MLENTSPSFLKTYLKGEAAFGLWGMVSKGIAGINALLIITNLDIYRYGLYVLIFSFYYIITGFFVRPLSEVVFNDIIRFHKENKLPEAKKLLLENFILRLGVAFIIFLGVFFGANLITRFYGEDLALLFRIISFVFIADAITSTLRVLIQINLRFALLAIRQMLYNGVKFLLLVSFLFFSSLNITEALLAHVIAVFIMTFSFIPLYIRFFRPWRQVESARHSVFLGMVKTHGKWAFLSQPLMALGNNARPWLIKFFISTEAVALYSVAESLFGAVKSLLPMSTLDTLIPREMSDRARRGALLLRGAKYFFIAGVALAGAGLLMIPLAVYLALPKYESSIPLFLILLIALPFISLRAWAVQFVIALRRQRFIFSSNVLKAALAIISPITLLYLFGIWGMALERILTALIIGTVYYWYLFRFEIDHPNWRALISFTSDDRKFLKKVRVAVVAYLKNLLATGKRRLGGRVRGGKST